ncbi:hypothetical protein SARC_14870, partial [Sphaeroforma arctica JP610]
CLFTRSHTGLFAVGDGVLRTRQHQRSILPDRFARVDQVLEEESVQRKHILDARAAGDTGHWLLFAVYAAELIAGF